MPHTDQMRLFHSFAMLVIVLVVAVIGVADRQWQTGTLVDVATKRSPWVGDPSSGTGPLTARPTRPVMPEVAVYVIETEDRRIELEDIVAIGSRESFELHVAVGGPVTFALSKKTAYIRLAEGKEYRVRVTRNTPRTKR